MPCKSLGYGIKPCKRPASLETKVEGTLAKGKSQPQGVTKSLGKGKKALEKGKKALEKGKKTLEKRKKPLRKGRKPLRKGRKPLRKGTKGRKMALGKM